MHNFPIGFDFVKQNTFLNQTYILAVFNEKASAFILKNKSIFTFNDTRLDTQRFDQKINYNYITRFKF